MSKMKILSLSFPLASLSIALLLTGCSTTDNQMDSAGSEDPPNIVLILLDDAGWADFEPFAETRWPTPNVATLAEEGRRFNNFYVPQPVCSSSRGALLTGTYPERNGMIGAHGPRERGMDPSFATMGDMFREAGYRTASFGKWHIGDQPGTRMHERGFDESSGIMYSNDMWADHPENPEYWGRYPLQYWENGEVVIDSVTAADQTQFTTWATEDAVDFIERSSEEPFFLYVPHIMPHVPIFVSNKFDGASGTGLYGDVIMELDWSVGEIMSALEETGVKENTIFIFTSDNGPWLRYGNHSGQTPFREGKGTSLDGGVRSPLIISWPGHLEAGSVSHDTFFSIDFMPTLARLTGADLPDHELDGKDVWELISGEEGADNPHDYYAVSFHNELQAVLSADGKWKLVLPHEHRTVITGGRDGQPGIEEMVPIELSLYDMVHDPYEKANVIDEYPEIADQLMDYAEEFREQFYEE